LSANPNTRAIDNRLDKSEGLVWNRLHSEREEICAALLKESVTGFGTEGTTHEMSKEDAVRTASWHKELLQARLRKIDDAIDRLMSGSYGSCCKCGRSIEDTKIEFDPAIAFCIDCWLREQSQTRTDHLTGDKSVAIPKCALLETQVEVNASLEGVALETLKPFDMICVRTRNSDYCIFLLDPRSGRVLVEGGQFVEPVEAMVNGSTLGASTFKIGWIGIGFRMEFWTDGKLVSTSPVQSVRVEHHTSAEPALATNL